MINFKQFLRESEEHQGEHQEEIHSMPLETAKDVGDLHLVSDPTLFDNNYLPNKNHGFVKYLMHPDHSDESVIDGLNELLRLAHVRDKPTLENYDSQRNAHQLGVLDFAYENYPSLAFIIGNVAAESYFNYSTKPTNPIQIDLEQLQKVKARHGYLKRGTFFGKKNYSMIGEPVFHDHKNKVIQNLKILKHYMKLY